jgi:hypothetical protein
LLQELLFFFFGFSVCSNIEKENPLENNSNYSDVFNSYHVCRYHHFFDLFLWILFFWFSLLSPLLWLSSSVVLQGQHHSHLLNQNLLSEHRFLLFYASDPKICVWMLITSSKREIIQQRNILFLRHPKNSKKGPFSVLRLFEFLRKNSNEKRFISTRRKIFSIVTNKFISRYLFIFKEFNNFLL